MLVACPENSLVGAKVPSILYIAFVLPILSDQTSVASGLPPTYRHAVRAAAFPDVDWRVRARFRRGSDACPPVPSLDNDEEAGPDRPVFSLVTGRYRHAKRCGGGQLWYYCPIQFFC